MRFRYLVSGLVPAVFLALGTWSVGKPELYPSRINVDPPHFSRDRSVKLDYDIVYVRTPRHGDQGKTTWAEISNPGLMDPGADLMLLHPDGSEEVLVQGGRGSVADPYVSLDGEWVYYAYFHDLQWYFDALKQGQTPPFAGSDIYKIHVKSRKIVRLTQQVYTPNMGVAVWSSDFRTPEEGRNYIQNGVYNLGPCPLPGGKLVFTSSRNAFIPPKHHFPTLQLFVMDDDGNNVECIGHLNIGMALHPVVLKDGRIIFSSLESQGLRAGILWGIWSIHPDGTNWGPVVSAFDLGGGSPNAFHFQTQLSDGFLVVEQYYNQNNWGFGAYLKLPPRPPEGEPAFGPAFLQHPRNPPLRFGRYGEGWPRHVHLPFSPHGVESLTRFANNAEGPANVSDLSDPNSPRVGKFTHPSGAPDNHLLTVWSPGPVNHQYAFFPVVDGGLYLIKEGKPIDEPGQMLLIKNDPNYNEQWPRALVPYRRIYGIDEPRRLPPLANDGSRSKHLPEGTPYGLVGTSSFYKRESYPSGIVPEGKVTAEYAGHDRTGYRNLSEFNWINQGAEAGVYANSDVHAVRILAMEPTTDRSRGPKAARLFQNHANERLRILGEIPLRKFNGGKQPTDPDGNPDTSFLAKIPADVAWTFQTLDKHGMQLNMSQTWHQLRPGEIRNDCGGCHAHSQKPTDFKLTAAAKPDYDVFDLTQRTPLLTSKARDESGKRWDVADETGLRYESSVKNVEFFRDIRPILERSCVACHTSDKAKAAPGQWLELDDDPKVLDASKAYFNLVQNANVKPKAVNSRGRYTPSRFIAEFQSRRSLLVWKVYGRRLDGFSNDDFPSPAVLGDPKSLQWKGKPAGPELLDQADIDYVGGVMPPPSAVAGSYLGPDGKKVKVEALSDEDRRTIVRWIDLGCPIDLDYNPARPQDRGFGWMVDDYRPTLTLTYPRPNANRELSRILVGIDDFYSGLNMNSFEVVADFPVNGVPAGRNLASMFREKSQGTWELRLGKPITGLPRGKLTVSVRDQQGNIARIERLFSVGTTPR